MEIIQKPKGRPRVLTDNQRKQNKTRYQLTKECICPICYPKKKLYDCRQTQSYENKKKHKKMRHIYDVVISITPEGNVHKEIM